MFKQFLQDIEQKRNDLLLLCVEPQNYFLAYQSFNHLMQTILNIFFLSFYFYQISFVFFSYLLKIIE